MLDSILFKDLFKRHTYFYGKFHDLKKKLEGILKKGKMSPKIGNTRLGVDRVKPWNSVRINLGLGLRGLDIRHLIIEGHRGY